MAVIQMSNGEFGKIISAGIKNDPYGRSVEITAVGQIFGEYDYKIFENNNVPMFCELGISRINNKIMYKYNVSGYESMTEKFYAGGLTGEDLKSFFISLKSAVAFAKEYLLCVDAIVLNADYIFEKSGKYAFCYFPGVNVSFRESLKNLMEEILKNLDNSEKKTIMLGFGLYQRILKDNCTLDSLMEYIYNPFDENDGKNCRICG